jgi:hypothetical protein
MLYKVIIKYKNDPDPIYNEFFIDGEIIFYDHEDYPKLLKIKINDVVTLKKDQPLNLFGINSFITGMIYWKENKEIAIRLEDYSIRFIDPEECFNIPF